MKQLDWTLLNLPIFKYSMRRIESRSIVEVASSGKSNQFPSSSSHTRIEVDRFSSMAWRLNERKSTFTENQFSNSYTTSSTFLWTSIASWNLPHVYSRAVVIFTISNSKSTPVSNTNTNLPVWNSAFSSGWSQPGWLPVVFQQTYQQTYQQSASRPGLPELLLGVCQQKRSNWETGQTASRQVSLLADGSVC